MKVLIEEVQNAQSRREGYVVEVESLRHAEEIAVEKQSFEGTVLVLRNAKTDKVLSILERKQG